MEKVKEHAMEHHGVRLVFVNRKFDRKTAPGFATFCCSSLAAGATGTLHGPP